MLLVSRSDLATFQPYSVIRPACPWLVLNILDFIITQVSDHLQPLGCALLLFPVARPSLLPDGSGGGGDGDGGEEEGTELKLFSWLQVCRVSESALIGPFR